jgi:Rrf2 family transcriptional regulator, nitric oxide-sensitive transcriptional repressor
MKRKLEPHDSNVFISRAVTATLLSIGGQRCGLERVAVKLARLSSWIVQFQFGQALQKHKKIFNFRYQNKIRCRRFGHSGTDVAAAARMKCESPTMLSKTAEYALRAITCIAGRLNQPTSADELSKATQVPRRYLNRVLQDLVAVGLVNSRSGPGGGYDLALAPSKITILDVVNAVSPLERIRVCPLGLKSHKKLCPLHAELDRAYAATEAAFARVTVKQLLDSSSPIIPLSESDD